jgi:hypothetical protein
MTGFRRSPSDTLANAISISVAFTSAIFAGYMILYETGEPIDANPKQRQAVVKDPIDRRSTSPRQWAEVADRSDQITTASIRDPADVAHRKLRPATNFEGDALTNSYTLRAVFQGTALIEIKNELSAELWPATEGTFVPGAGKVIAIEKRDDRWQVVTTERIISENKQ